MVLWLPRSLGVPRQLPLVTFMDAGAGQANKAATGSEAQPQL